MNRLSVFISFILVFTLSGCVTMGKKTQADKRQAVLEMKETVLSDLFHFKPDVEAQITRAAGYGVFSNANVKVIFASVGGGYGVVKNNRTGKYTYMKMGELGLGLGLGVRDFRAVFVFHNADTLNRFINQGWAFGVQADAAAKAGDKGLAVGGEATVDHITIYQLTENGFALQATIKGTKYWNDAELN